MKFTRHKTLPHSHEFLAFVHIRKCAGTTLLSILRSNFCLRHLDINPATKRHKRFIEEADLRFALRFNPFLRSIAGHKVSPAGHLERSGANIRYIVTLREPRSRYLSDFVYHAEQQRRTYTWDKWLSMEQFKNYQTKAIAGTSDVRVAIDIIENQLWLVGICEAYNEFLLMLRKKLALPSFDIRYTARRVATERDPKREARHIDWDRYNEEIFENNKSDYELYNYVKETVIPRQKKEYGPDLESDLTRFEQDLACYRPNITIKESISFLYDRLFYRPLCRLAAS